MAGSAVQEAARLREGGACQKQHAENQGKTVAFSFSWKGMCLQI